MEDFSKWFLCSNSIVLVLNILLQLASITAQPPACIRPADGISIQLSQLEGVWYEQISVNFGPVVYDISCDRMQFVTTSNTTAIVVKSDLIQSTGVFTLKINKMTMVDPGLIRFDGLTDTSIQLYMFPRLLNKDAFVFTNCYVVNNTVQAILSGAQTRKQTVSKTYLQDLMKQVKIQINETFYFDNNDDCYKMPPRCGKSE